jgi:hypothetical protein
MRKDKPRAGNFTRKTQPANTTATTTDNNHYSYKPPPISNGTISTNVRLACALWYFSGGSPYDIMCKYGISHAVVMESVWFVVDTVNALPEFYIEYPADHKIQEHIAAQFRLASSVDFDTCAGAIDRILIWIHKPTRIDAAKAKIGVKKFFCGRKHKFGLNCQAVADK